jgi:hypothetical protein
MNAIPSLLEDDQDMGASASQTGLSQAEPVVSALTGFDPSREQIRREIINAPETADFMAGVPIEAAHQRERWGSYHDAGKTPFDWFWLVGYLAQKAAASAVAGDIEKAKHHTISTAGALANWHAALSGIDHSMRPGIDPVRAQNGCAGLSDPPNDPEREQAEMTKPEPGCGAAWICEPCQAVNDDIRQKCRFCKKPRSASAIEAATADKTTEIGLAEGESAVPKGDAQ